MKTIQYLFILSFLIGICFSACEKEKENEQSSGTNLLTSHVWISDSLLADGNEAGGQGDILYGFSGETKFNEDGTGYVGIYEGTWDLSKDGAVLTIDSDSLPAVVSAVVKELTESSLKITTTFPSQTLPIHLYQIRMTFIPK